MSDSRNDPDALTRKDPEGKPDHHEEEGICLYGDDQENEELEDQNERDGSSEPENTDTEDEMLPDSDMEEDGEVMISFEDGEEISLEDLRKSYVQNKTCIHDAEILAQERRELEISRQDQIECAAELQDIFQNLNQFLENLIPKAPDLSLAKSDPGEYQYQMALRDCALKEIEQIRNERKQLEGLFDKLSKEEFSSYAAQEEEKLLSLLPTLKDNAKMEAFKEANKKTALQFGFTEQEIGTTLDHRILHLVHYARIGKIAEQNRKNAGRRIAEKPKKAKGIKLSDADMPRNRNAMRYLDKTGSIQAAMAVEFD